MNELLHPTIRRALSGVDLPADYDDSGYEQEQPSRNGKKRVLRILSDVELEKQPKPPQLVEGILLEESHAMLWGPPGAGKGFAAIDMLGHIRIGKPWHGHPVKRVGCVYLALERRAGLGARMRAWKAYHGVDGLLGVYFPDPITLFEPHNVDTLLTSLELVPDPVGMIVVDTHGKAILPGDENSTRDNGIYNVNIDRLKAETGGAVLEIHHGNAAGERERGNTALLASVDTAIEARADNGFTQLIHRKSSELEPFLPLSYQIVPHKESAVAVPSAKEGLHYYGALATQKERELLAAFALVQRNDRASNTAWMDAAGVAKRTYYHTRKALADKGYVREEGNSWQLSDLGRRLLQETPVQASAT